MGALGNPLSLTLGGGPTPSESIYDALYQNVGTGLRSAPGSLVEEWRMARARGIAAATSDERAAHLAFPDLTEDFLPVWEEILGVSPPVGSSLEDRRIQVTVAYTRLIDATWNSIEETLAGIDPLLSVLILPPEYVRTTIPGRAFQDWNPADPAASGPAYNLYPGSGGTTASGFPNYSDDFVLFLKFDVGAAILSPSNQRTLAAVELALSESLPAWVDWRIYSDCGFILDDDLLDATVFCDGLVIP